MYYVDSQRTLTRRDSSLILTKRLSLDEKLDYDALSTARRPSTARLLSESGVSLTGRQKGAVEREIVTLLFESMLDSIIESWDVIETRKTEELLPNAEVVKTPSELTLTKKKKVVGKSAKAKKSMSKLELFEGNQNESTQHSWWMSPDERAVIRFKNGNIYEGNISMKCMHGEGRFQWADGTVYLGQFKNNEINGKGLINWKDDTWYEGDFQGNLRHGKGIYVDSRKQRSYTGGWDQGTKHGEGVIYYSECFKNSYNGEWTYNIRHGFGSREYCAKSGYKGGWDKYSREGNGLMIWPNHDFYRGEWKNGVMSGYGIYIWNACYNNSMSLPSITAYRGNWEKGLRHGTGLLKFGTGLGSYYKGEFKYNKKHGAGKLVTNNGLIIHDRHLFIDDNVGTLIQAEKDDETLFVENKTQSLEPFQFDMCNDLVGLIYHVEQALKNIDRQQEIRTEIVDEFMENNKLNKTDMSVVINKESKEETDDTSFKDLVDFEVSSLYKSLRCYKTDLKHIYYLYATICNTEEIYFTPVLIRLYLWQLYFDCNMHEKGLNLVEIDRLFYKNSEWLAKTSHNPFEKIYFWQFLHSLISVASHLYAKKQLPDKKPDTIVATAFRSFMDNDILPEAGRRKGRLCNGYGKFVPLKGLYDLYQSLGEPCTIRTFLCAIHYQPNDLNNSQRLLLEYDYISLGRNAYIFGDEMMFVGDEAPYTELYKHDLKLFNLGNVPSKTIIRIFSAIFPKLIKENKIVDLEIELTFFEFFEAFIACAEESLRLTDAEVKNVPQESNVNI